ncbi:dihydrodipicolinate synthase family protein [Alkalihalobacillus sp. TS-13]|uniref:dihydrodipicolinate synthase family protein n=1 Tax=Alkalihalobacillus sp. TS-13 TaxID=2842455 RepID=UPI001C86BAEE|nr:dihydrodipicolinate synthase family protein [Alkalihalobacillus sp. TS-13]
MFNKIPNGVWPTMITPFTKENEVDYLGLERLIEWYIERNVNGLFAVCQSSEVFYLSLKERLKLARFIVEKVNGRIPVIAGGNISESITDQIEEIRAMSQTGTSATVLLVNRLASPHDSEQVLKENLSKILNQVPNIKFGLYECPYPFHRLLSAETLQWVAETNRFLFIKETSCNLNTIKSKIDAVKKSDLKIFNANAATFKESLEMGVSGYSGIMANFHPELYVWLVENWFKESEEAEALQHFLSVASVYENQLYPTNAKYYLILEGLNISEKSRVHYNRNLKPSQKIEIEHLRSLTEKYIQRLKM